MLVIQPKVQILKKIIQTPAGEYVLATFAITEFQGTFKAKLVSVEALPASDFDASSIVSLPALKKQSIFTPLVTAFAGSIVSPFFDKDLFISTQPTRAPSSRA